MGFFKSKKKSTIKKLSHTEVSIVKNIEDLHNKGYTTVDSRVPVKDKVALADRIISQYKTNYPNESVEFRKDVFLIIQIYKTSLKK